MAYYRVKLGYETKRGMTAVNLNVKADDTDEAVNLVADRYLRRYPARHFLFSEVREATRDEIDSWGVANG